MDCSEAGYSAGGQSARLRLANTVAAFSCNGSETDTLTASPSGMTCELSTGDHGVDAWILSLADSPVRTSVPPARGPGSRGRKAGSGLSLEGSLARYDRSSRSWRTAQCLLLGGSEEFSATFPNWGSMRGGELFRLKTPSGLVELRQSIKSAEESGFSGKLATPTANMGERGGRGDLLGAIRNYKYTKRRHRSQAEKLPTPGAAKANNDLTLQCSGDGRKKPNKLGWAIATKLPTPHGFSKDGGKSNGPSGNELGRSVNQSVEPGGGSLNPDWVEWLMGWPIGWTDLRPLETDRFRKWLELHGSF